MDEPVARRLTQRWWDEVWRDGHVDVAREILTDPFVRHTAAGTAVTPLAEYVTMLAEFQRTLWHPETTVDDQVVSADRVWTRATSRGFNRDTGEPTVVTWLIVQRIEHGRIAEHWLLTGHGVDWTA